MTGKSDVAVVVGNYQGERLLPECLDSISAQTLRPAQTIVVDASSTDRSASVAARPGVELVRRENRGLAHLYNEGVRASRAEYVLLANNDVSLDPRCLELLADALDADDRRFAADARQLDWAGQVTIHARTTFERGRLVREFIPGFKLDPVVSAKEVVATVCANGAAMLVRRSMFEQLGGFDETFFMDWEDLDLCWRAWLRGWPSVYVPDAAVRHRVGAVTTREVLPKRLTSSHHNLLRFALKCLPVGAAARVVAGELLRLPAHPRVIAPAVVSVLTELPQIVRLRQEAAPSRVHLQWVLDGMPA